MRRYRSLAAPAILILACSAGCDTEAKRQHRAEEARRNQAWEDSQRNQAETQGPTQEVMDQVKGATEAFLAEHHPELQIEGSTFTPLTPNCFLVGVAVKDLVHENRYVAQLTAERLRDATWGEDGAPRETGQLLWVMDYAEPGKMREMAQRHGFQDEVERIRDQRLDPDYQPSWGQRSWLDNYLLWHVLFHRPGSYGWRPGAGYAPMAPGFRMQDPARPITAPDAQRFQAAAAPTGGRSMVFLGGSAWRPPLLGNVAAPGQPFMAGRGGSVFSRGAMGSVSRGGFGAAGHAAATGG